MTDYLKAKSTCILTRTVEEYIHMFGFYVSNFAHKDLRPIIDMEDKEIRQREMKLVPTTMNEFKNNKYYTLPSLLRKYQGFLPTAKPLDFTFGKQAEPVYLRTDVTELHTVERWRKH